MSENSELDVDDGSALAAIAVAAWWRGRMSGIKTCLDAVNMSPRLCASYRLLLEEAQWQAGRWDSEVAIRANKEAANNG